MKISTLLLCMLVPTALIFAQSKSQKNARHDKGVMILTLGKDTTTIQSFEIRGDSIFSKILYLPQGLQLIEGKGTLYPDGNLKGMYSTVSVLSPDGKWVQSQETTVTSDADSTYIRVKRGETVINRNFAGRCYVTNNADIASFHLFPYRGFYAPAKVGDTLTSQHVGGSSLKKFTVAKIQKNQVRVGSSMMGYLTLVLDKKNRLQSIDGRGSSLNFTATVHRKLPFETLKNHFIQKQIKSGPPPSVSTRDTVRATIGTQMVTINYWRPSARGRVIFGEIVPMNRFWRVGANNATEISFTQPVYFGDQKLEAGKYTLFAMPSDTQWLLMFNGKTGIWGTEYDASADVLRVPMTVESLPAHVEKLTLSVMPSPGGGGVLNIEWEKTKTSVRFKME
ncbi:MAG: DUF2911 domain-containing protein [Saprospiraceae bacterium]|nr:DUF2911 domain-containing protein [Saprospiraceae bacterium]MDZ4702875.1 DUF2911 domain-containing protein [Saprospiraceae bacterium]